MVKKRICVFCGARNGVGEKYINVAEKTGILIGKSGYDMVYGGSSRGLMGIVANSAAKNGAKITGIFPIPLAPSDKDLHMQHNGITVAETCGTHYAADAPKNASSNGKYETLNTEMDETIFVNNMFERKDKMFNMSDIFLTLPGGLGTIDEFFEVFTIKSLGWHKKEVILINTDGYWDAMIQMINSAIANEFTSDYSKKLFSVFSTAEEAFEYIEKISDK